MREEKVRKIAVTRDTLSSRGGWVFFVRYLSSIKIEGLLDAFFGGIRRSWKGVPIREIFKQIFSNFYDGTSWHLVHDDPIKKDEGDAGVVESPSKDLLSSHQVKRFFRGFSWLAGGLFRKRFKRLFIWRLKIKTPKVIKMTLDTMVMDNNEAKKRHGAEPACKGVLGVLPLQIIWDEKMIDPRFKEVLEFIDELDAEGVPTIRAKIAIKIQAYAQDVDGGT